VAAPARRRITFPTGGTAWAVDWPADGDGEGDALVTALGLAPPRPTVVLNGTTATLDDGVADLLGADGLAGVAAEDGLALVTGGTDAGVFALLGRALASPKIPLVGVAPAGLVTWPGRAPGRGQPADEDGAVPLEPHHTHFVLVDGRAWGDETPVLLAVAAALSRGSSSVAVVCGGGPVTRQEILGHARADRPIVVVAGSGRVADQLVAGEILPAPPARVTVSPLAAGPAGLAEAVRAALRSG